MAEPRPTNLARLKAKFEDFDVREVYERTLTAASDLKAQNFVIQFGPQHARIATNLDADDFEDLLLWVNDKDCPIRWINFWNTTKQEEIIDHIGAHYGFSRRLRASITAWDKYRQIIKRHAAKEKKLELEEKPCRAIPHDVEQGLNGACGKGPSPQIAPVQAPLPVQPPPNLEEVAHFKLAQSSMNYNSIDHGEKFTCIGANWLHSRAYEDDRLVPPMHWAWLTLCMSGETPDTVISIHEEANLEEPPLGGARLAVQLKELKAIRHNTLAVLKQLSTIGIEAMKHSALSLKSIREPLGCDQVGRARSATMVPRERMAEVGSSNLFYYLFEDTTAAVQVLGRSKAMLEHLMTRILRSAGNNLETKSNLIPKLHKLGKDLRLLQHLFRSYKTLIERILAPPDTDNLERIKLDQQARDRFRRLKDRLQLLMLNTIEEYLKEKTELSNTYFNLTQQKDSQATARLTQSATLLAKFSVFFLPITFMTSYFSVSIPGLMDSYTGKTYWISFGVIAAISFLCLFFFARLLLVFNYRLEAWADNINLCIARTFQPKKQRAKEQDADEDEDD